MQSQKTRVFKPRQPKNDQANITREPDGRSFRVSVRIKRADESMFERQARRLPTEDAARARRAIFYHEYNMLEGPGIEYALQYADVHGLDLAEYNLADSGFDEPPLEPVVEYRGPTFKEWAEECFAKHWANIPKTAPDYKIALTKHVFPRIGSVPLKDLTPSMIEDALNAIYKYPSKIKHGKKEVEVFLSINSVKAVRTAIGSCLQRAVKHKKIDSNPARGLQMEWEGMVVARNPEAPDTESGQIRLMTQEEIDTLVARSKGTPIYPMVLFQARLGLRISESLALKPSDFDMERRVVNITEQLDRIVTAQGSELKRVRPKTKTSKRTIPLPDSVLEFMEAWEGDAEAPITRNEAGKFLERRKAYTYWGRVLDAMEKDKVGLDPRPTPHDLRASFVSYMLNDRKVPATIVAAIVGHRDIRTTLSFYSKASDANLREAMAGIK